MLKSINLSISSACAGDCIFCPTNRGERIKQKTMTFELVEKIVDEVVSIDFAKKHRIERFIIGENGDAFLNDDIIRILRYIKSAQPKSCIWLITNFQFFSKDMAKVILKEKLVDFFHCNIDGSNDKNFFFAKGIDFKTVKKNLIVFLEERGKLDIKPPLHINVLTLGRYIKTIYKHFGFYPSKLKDHTLIKTHDDFAAIKNQFKKILDMEQDEIGRSGIFGWAERGAINSRLINYQNYSCPALERVMKEAFIAPDGTWYACCYDSNNELILGNIAANSIDEIYSNQTRKKLIEMLEKKEFAKIGGPCKTVNCCQLLYLESKLKKLLKRFIRHKHL